MASTRKTPAKSKAKTPKSMDLPFTEQKAVLAKLGLEVTPRGRKANHVERLERAMAKGLPVFVPFGNRTATGATVVYLTVMRDGKQTRLNKQGLVNVVNQFAKDNGYKIVRSSDGPVILP